MRPLPLKEFINSDTEVLDLQGYNWTAKNVSIDNTTIRNKLVGRKLSNGTITLTNADLGESTLHRRDNVREDGLDIVDNKSPILDWEGKRVLWLGTSIPHQGAGINGYPEQISQTLGFDVVNNAWSGSHANYDINGDAFANTTVRALSMTEADRQWGLATYGATSAYDDSFEVITKASEMTADYRILAEFQKASIDVVVLDHNHNDRKTEFSNNEFSRNIVTGTFGSTTEVELESAANVTEGMGCYVSSGTGEFLYAAGRVDNVSGNLVTIAYDSTGISGTPSGTLTFVDRATIKGSFDFLIAYIKNCSIRYSTDTEIILCNAPSYYTNNVDEDHSIWGVGYFIKEIADNWGYITMMYRATYV